jgi:long-chain fatty acid transport protein
MSAQASAASFQLPEYSVRDLGMADAGFAALAEDASTVFANPAGLTKLKGLQILFGGVGHSYGTSFSQVSAQDVLGNPISGGNTSTFIKKEVVPDLFIAAPVADWLSLGLGVTIPFGTTIDYSAPWVGRYQATNTRIRTVDINPSFGVKLTDWLSVGFGISAQYGELKLSNAIDIGAECFTALNDPFGIGHALCTGAGLTPGGAATVLTTTTGKDWGIGWDLGVLADLGPTTRVGLSYRSKVDHTLKGDANFTVSVADVSALTALVGTVVSLNSAFTGTATSSGLDFPSTLALSIHQQVSKQVAILGTISFVGWSSVKGLNIDYANPAQPDVNEAFAYKDTIRAALGVSYDVTDALTLRAGASYDESPEKPGQQSAHVPSSDLYSAGAGLSWKMTKRLNLDVAYQYVMAADENFDRTGMAGDRVRGTYKFSGHQLGLALTIHF